MNNHNEEIMGIKALYETGQIDENTYHEELKKIKENYEDIEKTKKANKEYSINERTRVYDELVQKDVTTISLTKAIKFILAFIIIFYIFFNIFIQINNPLKVDKSVDLSNIPPPIQIETDGSNIKKVDGYNVYIYYKAAYSISGKVVGTYNYFPTNLENKISPKDVGIAWGEIANDKKHITWRSSGNRFLYWSTFDGNWLSSIGGENVVNKSSSNNHLIPFDENVEKNIKKINKNDYVKIDGYLVNITAAIDNGNFVWNTSTNRNDTGNGACEVLYVTSVTWLK